MQKSVGSRKFFPRRQPRRMRVLVGVNCAPFREGAPSSDCAAHRDVSDRGCCLHSYNGPATVSRWSLTYLLVWHCNASRLLSHPARRRAPTWPRYKRHMVLYNFVRMQACGVVCELKRIRPAVHLTCMLCYVLMCFLWQNLLANFNASLNAFAGCSGFTRS